MDPFLELHFSLAMEEPSFRRKAPFALEPHRSASLSPTEERRRSLCTPELVASDSHSTSSRAWNEPTHGELLSIKQLLSLIRPVDEITDDCALRHLFWVLHGVPTELFPLQQPADGGKPADQKEITLKELSGSCSANILNEFIRMGCQVRQLIDFTDPPESDDAPINAAADASTPKKPTDRSPQAKLSCTMNAYVQALRDFVQFELQRKLHEMTTRCWHQDEAEFTVLNFHKYLQSPASGHLQAKLATVHTVHEQIVRDADYGSPHRTTVILLNHLYRQLRSPPTSRQQKSAPLWELFLSSFRPTLVYLQELFVSGHFYDPHQEFFFAELPVLLTENFWDECLEVRCGSQPPLMLESHWKQILIGVKSRLLISQFERGFRVNQLPGRSLFDMFLDELFRLLNCASRSPVDSDGSAGETQQGERDAKLVEQLQRCFVPDELQLKLRPEDEHLRQHFDLSTKRSHIEIADPTILDTTNHQFDRLAEPTFRGHLRTAIQHGADSGPSTGSANFRTMPVHHAFHLALEKALHQFVRPICDQILALFKSRFLHHVQIMNSYYLMQLRGHQLSLYFDRLFADLVQNPQRCRSKLPSNFYSLDAFDRSEKHSQHVIAYFSFTVESNESNVHLSILSTFYLLYRDLDPITETVLNSGAKQFYQDCFQRMLRFRFGKWTCENLRLDSRAFSRQRPRSMAGYGCFHLLFLVKHHINFVLNSIYSPMMQRIDEQLQRLTEQVERCSDYEQMRDCFRRFRAEVERSLWLSRDTKSILMRNLVDTLCGHAFRLREIWADLQRQFERDYSAENEHRRLLSPGERLAAQKEKKLAGRLAAKLDDQPETSGDQSPDQSTEEPVSYELMLAELQRIHDFLTNNKQLFRMFDAV